MRRGAIENGMKKVISLFQKDVFRYRFIGVSHKQSGEDVFAFLGQSRLCPYTNHALFSPQ